MLPASAHAGRGASLPSSFAKVTRREPSRWARSRLKHEGSTGRPIQTKCLSPSIGDVRRGMLYELSSPARVALGTHGCVAAVSLCSIMFLLQGAEALLLPFAASALATWVLCAACEPILMAHMQQPIRSVGPASHHSKAGTPTAGGAVFIPVACVTGACIATSPASLVATAAISATAAVGLLDDYLTVHSRPGTVRGLRAKQKLATQTVIGVLAALAALHLAPTAALHAAHSPRLALQILPGVALAAPPALYTALAAFTHVAEANAVNLSDGVDGLAASCAALALAGCAAATAPLDIALATLCAALAGACTGFLGGANRHPARMFMGDTGSQALGAALASVAALTGAFAPVALMSLVFVAEVASVLLQVSWFRWTLARTGAGRKLFRMSPLHHHFELSGVREPAIVQWAAGIQALACFATLYLCMA